MDTFATLPFPSDVNEEAPDGSTLRALVRVGRGTMAHFELAPGCTSRPVVHRTVDEMWFVLRGHGEIWRKRGTDEAIVALVPGTSLTIPSGTSFQFRSTTDGPLTCIGVTMPPWPGNAEAEPVPGPWTPSAAREWRTI